MGGYKAGEVASEIAVLMIASEIKESMQRQINLKKTESRLMPESNFLVDAVRKTNTAIYHISKNQPQCAGMGTTLVASIFANNKLTVGHIGDSRMYCLRGDVLTQLTEDHSLIQEQINEGLITPAQAKSASHKNLVTRALGIDPYVELELKEFEVEVGDMYLMCSDGLSDLVEDIEIAKILSEADGNITLAAKKLVQTANECGGSDNISVVIASVDKPYPTESRWVKNLFGG